MEACLRLQVSWCLLNANHQAENENLSFQLYVRLSLRPLDQQADNVS